MNESLTPSKPRKPFPSGLPQLPRGARVGAVEWPTAGLIMACSTFILGLVFLSDSLPTLLIVVGLALALALHSSLQHEVLHGHPTRCRRVNEALVFVPFGLFVPYQRFRDLHLQHHVDERLTDPYDDPESHYVDPDRWHRLPRLVQALLILNNTLMGRMVIGPLIGLWMFLKVDLRRALDGERAVIRAYGLHIAALLLWTYAVSWHSDLSIWAYVLAAYLAMSLLKVRTFLEHRAHEDVAARTAIVEDQGWLAWLFLNNNLHLVHHRHPRAPWYRLPALYRCRRQRFLRCNRGYVYPSYGVVFRTYLFRRKEPVPHPLTGSSTCRTATGTQGARLDVAHEDRVLMEGRPGAGAGGAQASASRQF